MLMKRLISSEATNFYYIRERHQYVTFAMCAPHKISVIRNSIVLDSFFPWDIPSPPFPNPHWP